MKLFLVMVSIVTLNSGFASSSSHYDFLEKIDYEFDMKNAKDYSYNIAVHSYTQKKTSNKLFISVHGYMDNCGYFQDLHSFLFNEGFDVICLDLPGHGLSSGKMAQIKNFKEYGQIFEVLDMADLRSKYDNINFIAHSTGAVTFVESQKRNFAPQFDKVILLAPLGRTRSFRASMLLHTIAGRFITKLPRKSSSQEKFIAIQKTDPNYIDFIATEWVSALKVWDRDNKRVGELSSDEIHIIFGEKDDVINNKFTQSLYQKMFPNQKTYLIDSASHQMSLDEKKISHAFYFLLNSLL